MDTILGWILSIGMIILAIFLYDFEGFVKNPNFEYSFKRFCLVTLCSMIGLSFIFEYKLFTCDYDIQDGRVRSAPAIRFDSFVSSPFTSKTERIWIEKSYSLSPKGYGFICVINKKIVAFRIYVDFQLIDLDKAIRAEESGDPIGQGDVNYENLTRALLRVFESLKDIDLGESDQEEFLAGLIANRLLKILLDEFHLEKTGYAIDRVGFSDFSL